MRGKYPIELKAYLDLCTVRENSMGKIKTWKIDVWFIENKNINIFREHTKFWYFIVWLNPIKPTQRLKGLDFGQTFSTCSSEGSFAIAHAR